MDIIQVLKDLVTMIAAITASVVAVLGLSAWKKQLKGKTYYELARRYLGAVYKARDAIRYVRAPFIASGEIITALKESGYDESDYADRKKSDQAVYSRRWKKLTETLSVLELEQIDAEVSWGKEVATIAEDFNKCWRKLYSRLNWFLRGGEGMKPEDIDIIYDMGEDDEFNKEIKKAVEQIEVYLKKHLK
ncbi:MAG: hypothetical protein HYT65_02670 [Candidatus Yanofskybacteria bacterium]|nr:hypothetical protein [Candidatus Yanofskybacteria bacterium]